MKMLALAVLALFCAFAVPARAAVTTTSEGAPINASFSLGAPLAFSSCSVISISTTAPTLVDAADAGRRGYFVQNVSSQSMSALGQNTGPYARIWITSAPATNLTAAELLASSNYNKINGIQVPSCDSPANAFVVGFSTFPGRGATSCRLDKNAATGSFVGAIYAIAEGSQTTTGFDPLPRLEYCEDK